MRNLLEAPIEMAKILIVDDDVPMCEVIESWLKYNQHVVECVHSGGQARELLELYEYDAVVLDWKLPDIAGVDVLKQYRGRGGKTPVLMLTGRNQIDEKEIGFDAGADDYLTKPFEMRELSARLRALLRRPPAMVDDVLTAGDIALDLKTHSVTKCGAQLKLYPKEYSLLEYLMRHQNKVCSSDELVSHVWRSEDGVAPDALRTCLRRLRKHIDSDGAPSLIENLHGVGYVLRVPSES